MRYLITGLCLILVGCAAIDQRQQMDLLDSTSRAYGKAIRWGYFDTAQKFIKQNGGSPASANNKYRDIKVTSYEKASSTAADDLSYAIIVAEIRYYNESSAVERKLTDRQRWEYDAAQKKWHLNGKLPVFK